MVHFPLGPPWDLPNVWYRSRGGGVAIRSCCSVRSAQVHLEDSSTGDLKYDAEEADSVLQARLETISREHEDFCVDGTLLAFNALETH